MENWAVALGGQDVSIHAAEVGAVEVLVVCGILVLLAILCLLLVILYKRQVRNRQ